MKILGLDCVSTLEPEYQECVKACTGVYSDVSKDENAYDKSIDTWQNVIKSYKQYKNLFNKDIVYPSELSGLHKSFEFYFSGSYLRI